jgi:hypothetical protein
MKLRKLKSLKAGRLRRTVLALGLAGGLVGGLLLSAGPAYAAYGSAPGDLSLSPTSGALTTTAGYATTEGCPTGYQASAVVEGATTTAGSYISVSSVMDASAGAVLTAAFTGTLAAPMATIESLGGFATGGTQELFVQCASETGDTGNTENVMSTFVTYNTATTYETEAAPPSTSTTTTLTSSNAAPTTCTSVTLTATEVAADGTNPAGSVQFLSGTSDIGGAVAVNASGVATTTTTFSTAGTYSVTAVFTPTSSSYASSTSSAVTETVTTGTSCTSGAEPLSVDIATSGTFTLTVPTGTVTLVVSGSTATGALNTITVSDTRNTFPGWSVTGQTSNFAGSGTAAGQTISGDQLGWVPTDTALATGATLGPTVAPGTSPGGLEDTAAVLASAVPGGGGGTSSLSANLTLDIPAAAFAGPYAATMTITAVTTGP